MNNVLPLAYSLTGNQYINQSRRDRKGKSEVWEKWLPVGISSSETHSVLGQFPRVIRSEAHIQAERRDGEVRPWRKRKKATGFHHSIPSRLTLHLI